MKSLFKKSLTLLGITAAIVGAYSSVSYASISWDSYATWYGEGARAYISAYTSKTNEPYYYKITVSASTNDGSNLSRIKDNALTTDVVSVNFLTNGPVSSGTSFHEWIMLNEDGHVQKSIDFPTPF